MITDFAQRFDSYFAASCDLRDYMQAKGYWEDGDRMYWEPQDETDLEPATPVYAPGAMTVGELDDWDASDIEEF